MSKHKQFNKENMRACVSSAFDESFADYLCSITESKTQTIQETHTHQYVKNTQ